MDVSWIDIKSIFDKGNVALINWLLGSGGDGGIADSSGDLPLHYAAIGAKPLAILTLVDKGKQNFAYNLRIHTILIWI